MSNKKDGLTGPAAAEITVVLIRPEHPNPDVLDHVYQILASAGGTKRQE